MKNYQILLAAETIFSLSSAIFGPIFAIYIQNIGGENILNVGWTFLVFAVMTGLTAVISGKLSDKHGRKKLLLLGAALAIPVPFLYIFVTDIFQVLALQIINGISSGIVWPAWAAMLAEATQKDKRATQYGYYAAVESMVPGISTMMASAIVYFLGFQMMFLVMGLISIFGFLALCYLNED